MAPISMHGSAINSSKSSTDQQPLEAVPIGLLELKDDFMGSPNQGTLPMEGLRQSLSAFVTQLGT
jgi:hypothetical protein